jgi:PhnB protein
MKPTPYLHFDGNCKQALDYYAEHLSGKVAFSMTYGEMPPQPAGAPAAESGCKPDPNFAAKIGHARMMLGEGVIMVSDCPPGRYTKPDGFFISLDAKDTTEAKRIYDALSAKGEIFMPLGETFWAKAFAMFKDQFGIPWMINCEKEKF